MKRALARGLLLGVVLTGSLTAATVVALAASATLQVVPGPGTAFTAIYTYTPDAGAVCPQVLIIFTWDGAEVLGPAQPLINGRSGCQALLSTMPPTGAQPGPHAVCGSYTPPSASGGPTTPVKACGTFTGTVAATPSPTPVPTAAPVATTAAPTLAPIVAPVSTPSPTAALTPTTSPASSSLPSTSAPPSVSPLLVGGTRGTESTAPSPATPSDGGGGIAALTDGLLIIRYLFGLAVGVGVLLLGGLIIRYLFGLRGASLSTEMAPGVDGPAGGGGPGPAGITDGGNTSYDALTDGLMILRSTAPGPGGPAGGGGAKGEPSPTEPEGSKGGDGSLPPAGGGPPPS